jgi:hypothetical protein
MATPARRGDWLRTFRGQVAPWEACISRGAQEYQADETIMAEAE